MALPAGRAFLASIASRTILGAARLLSFLSIVEFDRLVADALASAIAIDSNRLAFPQLDVSSLPGQMSPISTVSPFET